MTPGFIAFELAGLGQAPDAVDVLAYGRTLAERSGLAVADGAQPRITQAADGSDRYRIEIPATFA